MVPCGDSARLLRAWRHFKGGGRSLKMLISLARERGIGLVSAACAEVLSLSLNVSGFARLVWDEVTCLHLVWPS